MAFMLGEVLFGTEIDFVNQRRFLPAVGQHRRAPAIPGARGRVVRTHEKYRAEYRRAIYVVRHVSDVAVSYYRWLSWLGVGGVGFDEFLVEFLTGRVDGWGPWQRHVSTWLEQPDLALYVVRYEDLQSDTEGTLADVLRFMGIEVDPRSVRSAAANNTITRMRAKQDRARETLFGSRNRDADFVRVEAEGERRPILQPDQVRLIEELAWPSLKRLGYSLLPAR